MGIIHKFSGDEARFDWQGVKAESYTSGEVKGVTKRVLVGPEEGAPYFVMRYFEVRPGGWTMLHEHPHDHGVLILKGKGEVTLNGKKQEVSRGDVIYVSPNERHQFKNTGNEIFGFICVIPNRKLVEPQ